MGASAQINCRVSRRTRGADARRDGSRNGGRTGRHARSTRSVWVPTSSRTSSSPTSTWITPAASALLARFPPRHGLGARARRAASGRPDRARGSSTRVVRRERGWRRSFGPDGTGSAGTPPGVSDDGERIDVGERIAASVVTRPATRRTTSRSCDSGHRRRVHRRRHRVHLPWACLCSARAPLPPEFDLELAVASIERIRARGRRRPAVRAFRADRRRRRTVSRIARPTGSTRGPTPSEARSPTSTRTRSVDVLPTGRPLASTVTGAEAQLDLDRLETLAGIRMNARGLARVPGEASRERRGRRGRAGTQPSWPAAPPRRTRWRRAASPCGTPRPPPRLRPARRGCRPSRTRGASVYVSDTSSRVSRPPEERERLGEAPLIGQRRRGHDHGLRLRLVRRPSPRSSSSRQRDRLGRRPSARRQSAITWFWSTRPDIRR